MVTAPATIAILGGNSVAGRALEALLQGVGYDTRLIEDPPERSLEHQYGVMKSIDASEGDLR